MDGAADMTFRFSRLAKALADGLRYSAKTAAMHEALPWDGEGRVAPMGLIRGLEIGAGSSGGVAGKRPRQR
jgi:hypothetical protein